MQTKFVLTLSDVRAIAAAAEENRGRLVAIGINCTLAAIAVAILAFTVW